MFPSHCALLLAAVLHVRPLCPRFSRHSLSVVAFHTQNLLQSLNSVQTSSPVPQNSLGNASMMRCRGPAAAAKRPCCAMAARCKTAVDCLPRCWHILPAAFHLSRATLNTSSSASLPNLFARHGAPQPPALNTMQSTCSSDDRRLANLRARALPGLPDARAAVRSLECAPSVPHKLLLSTDV